MSRLQEAPVSVVVTGVGLVTPLAIGREASWQRLCRGDRAGRWLDDESGSSSGRSSVRPAGASVDVPLPPIADFPDAITEPAIRYAALAADEAVAHARLDVTSGDSWRLGCVIGTSKSGLRSMQTAYERLCRSAGHSQSSGSGVDAWQSMWPNCAAQAIAARYQCRAAALCPVAACATGLISLIRGAELIRSGQCDAVIAGATDASLTPAVVHSFRRLGVLSSERDDPAAACRPFDRRRSGFIIGEGAGVLILERRDSAIRRNVPILAEWKGHALANEPAGITQLDPTARTLQRLVDDVLARAAIAPGELDYVNLHGTGTQQNDAYESAGLRGCFAESRGLCSSMKGNIGHLLGAAGAVETALTVLSLRDGIIPATANLQQPESHCELPLLAGDSRHREVRQALTLSFGFGGHAAAAVLSRVGG